MSPKYLEELADMVDPESLWRLPLIEQLDLPFEKRRQLDAGIALRRYASHIDRLRAVREEGRSLLITPLSADSIASKHVTTPAGHRRLREVATRKDTP
ncbi:hypothetical protein [Caldimonas sp. KR1-144]|uniref:hypothetical protein n=1 Tax=Caldimonas sp. KR1-144 TaxID=3400911 RepID=UPI003C0871D4